MSYLAPITWYGSFIILYEFNRYLSSGHEEFLDSFSLLCVTFLIYTFTLDTPRQHLLTRDATRGPWYRIFAIIILGIGTLILGSELDNIIRDLSGTVFNPRTPPTWTG